MASEQRKNMISVGGRWLTILIQKFMMAKKKVDSNMYLAASGTVKLISNCKPTPI